MTAATSRVGSLIFVTIASFTGFPHGIQSPASRAADAKQILQIDALPGWIENIRLAGAASPQEKSGARQVHIEDACGIAPLQADGVIDIHRPIDEREVILQSRRKEILARWFAPSGGLVIPEAEHRSNGGLAPGRKEFFPCSAHPLKQLGNIGGCRRGLRASRQVKSPDKSRAYGPRLKARIIAQRRYHAHSLKNSKEKTPKIPWIFAGSAGVSPNAEDFLECASKAKAPFGRKKSAALGGAPGRENSWHFWA